MRLGWAVATPEIIQAMVIAKQAADLHTCTITQRAAARLLEDFDYDGHVAELCSEYGKRCRIMISALERHFPSGSRWTHPQGGLFIWVELPETINGDELLEECMREHVAFVPGYSFFAREPRHNFIRLNFSNARPEFIEKGIERIGRAIKRRVA
jgi:2-aminoadipate transaminase